MDRILREIKDLETNPPDGCTVGLKGDNDVRQLTGSIIGPDDTPYEGGTFYLDIVLPEDYPTKPLTVTFTTKIYHPNVNDKGGVCLAMLKDDWNPSITISEVLLAVVGLLKEPNAYDPFAPEIAKHYLEDKETFVKTAREWTNKFAL